MIRSELSIQQAKCGREESNLHVFWTLEPESSASANSATAAGNAWNAEYYERAEGCQAG